MDLMLDRTDPTAQRYNLYRRGFKSWMRTNKLLRRLFSDVPSGFFLEAGALDGEFISNTLYLERELGWTGILVEADSTLYAAIAGKRRKVWVSHSCVSPASYAQKMTFEGYHAEAHASIEQRLLVRSTGNLAGVMSPAGGQMGTKVEEKIQCFPLFSYLLALNATSLHYISLDVEGAECDILLSLPWKRVNVSVLSIEHRDQNTCFREYYEMPFGSMAVTPQREENGKAVDSAVPHKTQQSKDQGPTIPHTAQQDVVVQTRVVYTNQHDPASGKDDYFVRFMKERGYVLYDYWDGDYTYIKMNSSVCERHCGESLPAGVELGSRG
nr:uncharacterized protein LOC128698791 [Cherax quadricarinatus]